MNASNTPVMEAAQAVAETAPEATAKQWARLRMAHEAVMLEDARAVLAQNRKLISDHTVESFGGSDSNGAEQSDANEEDMGNIIIGDSYYQGADKSLVEKADALLAAQSAGASPAVKPDSVVSGLRSWVLPGAIALAGVGGGLGLAEWFRPDAPAIAPAADPDTDTQAISGFRILKDAPKDL
jgi:hypothetical protein